MFETNDSTGKQYLNTYKRLFESALGVSVEEKPKKEVVEKPKKEKANKTDEKKEVEDQL